MEMILKPGVDILGIKPEAMMAVIIAGSVWNKYGQELVLTSVCDSQHSKYSRHNFGFAFDCRTRYFSKEEKKAVTKELKSALGRHFNVVVHSTHIHCAYKPQRP
jgi:hypothetical protein